MTALLDSALPVLPFVLVGATAFVKLGVVLAILRRALGGSSLPPAAVSFVLAVVLAAFVAAPVGEAALSGVATLPAKASAGDRWQKASEPVRGFFESHTPAREREAFVDLAKKMRPAATRDSVKANDLTVLAPAFCIAELRSAFQIGFFLFLPFLLIELVVGMVLAVLGLGRVSPEAVSLPFKLLLFVAVDGWHLLARGLLVGYGT
jgi:type III secretion protein R